MEMQHPSNMFNPRPIISTEQIQQYLDENKQLIIAILENQNLGKLAECASYQAQLKQNLEYLTQIADAQPQVLAMLSKLQMPSQSAVQQEHYMQPSQPAMSQQQPGFVTPNLPFQLNDHQQQEQHQLLNIQQQHLFLGQMGMRPGGNSSSYQDMQTRFGSTFVNSWGSKQDCSDGSAGDGLRK